MTEVGTKPDKGMLSQGLCKEILLVVAIGLLK
jgi:hypothetical protein